MDGLQVNTSSVTNGLNTAHASGAGEGPRPPPTPTDLANIPILSRTRVLPAEVEEAEVVLSLGEYQNLPAISNPEAKLLLGKLLEKRQQDAESAGGRFITTDTLNKTMDYLDAFARFRTETGITDVDKLLSNYPGRFEFFEKAQLGEFDRIQCLCCAVLAWTRTRTRERTS